MERQNQQVTETISESIEEAQKLNERREKIIENLKSISGQILNEDIKTLVDRNIVPNLNNYKDFYTNEIIISSIENLLIDTLNNKDDFIKTHDAKYLGEIIADLHAVHSLLSTCRAATFGLQQVVKEYLGAAHESVTRELAGFRKKRAQRDNAETESIYEEAVERYRKLEKKYRKYFYRCIFIVLVLAFITLLFKEKLISWFTLSTTEFWVLKASLLVVGITLISYFLKQSSHYQKLADQNYQTQVELQAYPSFMESIPTEEAASVRKELALKYFGREIDGTAHKDMSNLISDQMKNTTEMVKATTEAIKNLKG